MVFELPATPERVRAAHRRGRARRGRPRARRVAQLTAARWPSRPAPARCARSRAAPSTSTTRGSSGTPTTGPTRPRRSLPASGGWTGSTTAHWRVLRFLRAYYLHHGRAPMNRELKAGTGLSLVELERHVPGRDQDGRPPAGRPPEPQDVPGLTRGAGAMTERLIYLDNAATTFPKPASMLQRDDRDLRGGGRLAGSRQPRPGDPRGRRSSRRPAPGSRASSARRTPTASSSAPTPPTRSTPRSWGSCARATTWWRRASTTTPSCGRSTTWRRPA